MSISRCKIKEQLDDKWKVVFDIALVITAFVIGYFLRDSGSGAARGIVIGAVVGVFFHWRVTEKASLRIKNTLVPYAKNWVEAKGYASVEASNEFIPDTHRLLRFDSQNIWFSQVDESSTSMFGPYYILKMFAKSLQEKL